MLCVAFRNITRGDIQITPILGLPQNLRQNDGNCHRPTTPGHLQLPSAGTNRHFQGQRKHRRTGEHRDLREYAIHNSRHQVFVLLSCPVLKHMGSSSVQKKLFFLSKTFHTIGGGDLRLEMEEGCNALEV